MNSNEMKSTTANVDNSRRSFLRKAAAAAAALSVSRVLAATPLQERAPRRTSRPSHPPEMIEIPNYMVYAQLPDDSFIGLLGGLEKGQAVGRYSRDGGKTFGPKTALFPLDESVGNWSMHNVFLDHDGELQLLYTNDANTIKQHKPFYEMHFDIWHVRSHNSRQSWAPPTQVWTGYAGSLLSFTQLRNGRVIIPYTFRTPRTWGNRGKGFDAYAFMGRFSSSGAYSDDNGASWYLSPDELKEPTPVIGDDGGIEPIVLELKDGRVWMLIRTQWGRFYESISNDGGASWTAPRPTAITSGDSPCSLTRLADGRIVMMWNNNLRYCYANGGRAVLHGAISEDDGRSWRGYREIAANPLASEPPPPNGDHGVTYTVPALTHDGHLITSLTIGPGGGYYLLRLDPEWLYETRQEHDFSSGMAGWTTLGSHGVALEADPENAGRRVLAVRKPDSDWPAGAVWNFPAGRRGELHMRLQVRPQFAGAVIGLTDHFSVPFDAEDVFHNIYNFEIGSGGTLADGVRLQPGQWHDLTFAWDGDAHQCRVSERGMLVAALKMRRESVGPSYLRVRSTALRQDPAGLLIDSVSCDVSASWP
jgi:hypothetical protein